MESPLWAPYDLYGKVDYIYVSPAASLMSHATYDTFSCSVSIQLGFFDHLGVED